jgi:Tol biopolymer transport system component
MVKKNLLLLFFIAILGGCSPQVFVFRDVTDTYTDLQRGPVPKWSPVGDKYALITNSGNESRLLIINDDSITTITGAQNDFAWSRSGKSIVYTSKEKSKTVKVLQYHLPTGSKVMIAGDAKWSYFAPSISPDDSIITFYNGKDAPFQIYQTRNGVTKNLFNDLDTDYLYPKWSPSGKFLAYIKHKQPNHEQIEIIDFKSRQLIFEMDGSMHDFLDWAPNEQEILINEDRKRLIKVNFKNGAVMALTDTLKGTEIQNEILMADWNRQTNKIVFSTMKDIYLVNPDGTGLKKLYSPGALSTWHPSGQKIIFVKPKHGFSIYEIDSNGKNLKLLYDGRTRKKD